MADDHLIRVISLGDLLTKTKGQEVFVVYCPVSGKAEMQELLNAKDAQISILQAHVAHLESKIAVACDALVQPKK